MEKVITNPSQIRRPSEKPGSNPNPLSYDEILIRGGAVLSLKTKVLAVSIFLYFFIENGTLGLFSRDLYFVYRNVRLSDLILYSTVLYSLLCIREYMDLFNSRAFLILKILLSYILLEFLISAVVYKFNIIEYFFRLKLLWSSFLVFPFLLLVKRRGLIFLFKIIFPVAVVSNVLYIMSAVTGVAYLPDVNIITQKLPGDLEVFRVFGGTFFGELYLLGYVYYWITVRFRLYQLFFAILFIIPHILAFGRLAWAAYLFTFFIMVAIHSLRKRQIRIMFRQVFIFVILAAGIIFTFLKFIPNPDYYTHALKTRLFQGSDDVIHNEGSYGVRVLMQNNDLIHLWLNSNMLVGVGMHPMWVYKPESIQEKRYYDAFADVTWPAILAAYGVFGFILVSLFQVFYLKTSLKMILKYPKTDVNTLLLTLLFAKLTFDTFISFSYCLFSFGLYGMYGVLSLQIAVLVFIYENHKNSSKENTTKNERPAHYYSKKYYYGSYKTYKL